MTADELRAIFDASSPLTIGLEAEGAIRPREVGLDASAGWVADRFVS